MLTLHKNYYTIRKEVIKLTEITTKEVFDKYLETLENSVNKIARCSIDRPELYKYEENLGKQIFDMNEEELIGLLISFNKKYKTGEKSSMPVATIEYTVTILRAVFNYYIDNVRIIKNPWYSRKLRGKSLLNALLKEKESLTIDIIETAINKLKKDAHTSDYLKKYVECIVLLFYEGFRKPEEIVLLKENMINFKRHIVYLEGRTVHLSDRCFGLLMYVHDLDKIQSERQSYCAVPYQDGFFKFIIREKNVSTFSQRTLKEVSMLLLDKINKHIESNGYIINYKTIYRLGFYNYIVTQTSPQRAKELILSKRVDTDLQEFEKYARIYGFTYSNISTARKSLYPFVIGKNNN